MNQILIAVLLENDIRQSVIQDEIAMSLTFTCA